MLKKLGEATANPSVKISEAKFPAPFTSGLEYGAPARGTWNIVHVGMLIPQAHQIFVCAQGCLRGVVLTAAEMGASERFSNASGAWAKRSLLMSQLRTLKFKVRLSLK